MVKLHAYIKLTINVSTTPKGKSLKTFHDTNFETPLEMWSSPFSDFLMNHSNISKQEGSIRTQFAKKSFLYILFTVLIKKLVFNWQQLMFFDPPRIKTSLL